MKITVMGAGSTVFTKNLLGDVMLTPALRDCEIALYDIDRERLEESRIVVNALNESCNEGRARISTYLGVEKRREALRGADFVVETIGDTLGIGGIFRGLRTIHVLKDFARDMEEVCPDAWFLNYTNPMGILAGYMQRYTGVKTVGLCHSVQVVERNCMEHLGMDYGRFGHSLVAGINHMA